MGCHSQIRMGFNSGKAKYIDSSGGSSMVELEQSFIAGARGR
jgi:hypothetical protein